MKGKSYKTQGIVLARRDFSESDRILSVYSRDFGRISLLAKGVRKPKSRKRGHIEVFSNIIFQAARGKGIDIMTEVEVINNYSKIRKSLVKVSLAYYFMEVIGKITSENEANKILYESILMHLKLLQFTNEHKSLRFSFILSSLINLGFWPKDKPLINADAKLTEVLERNLTSVRVGKKILS